VFDAGTGALRRTLNNPTPAESDSFGISVALAGTGVLVGARNDDTGAPNAGSAYLFDSASGALLKTIGNPLPATGDLFGVSVSATETLLLIGARANEGGGTDAGTVYLYGCPAGDGRSRGDFDNSGCTDVTDFLFLLDNWMTVSSIGGDPMGVNDFLALLDNWLLAAGCSS